MKRRWYYWKWVLRTNRLLWVGLAGVLVLLGLVRWNGESFGEMVRAAYERYGVWAAETVMRMWLPGDGADIGDWERILVKQPEIFSYLAEQPESVEYGEDPAYERMLASAWERKVLEENEKMMDGGSGDFGFEGSVSGNFGGGLVSEEGTAQSSNGSDIWIDGKEMTSGEGGVQQSGENGQWNEDDWIVKEAIAVKPAGSGLILEKLADYDYVMKNFYSVHPTTTAGRDMIQAETFLSMDFSIEKNSDQPQILIYHTHSQEEFSDFDENPDATIVRVGAYLAELLEAKGYRVIHDTSVYDMKNGTLDRSQAYTYALDGITGILQEYPSIEVVLDLHRDGVNEGTHLVTEVNGKPTAQIMLFNGTSQTPDGPIEYLQNPNRQANLAFSFQMQLAAKERYPGWTRKIYLKGLRYNQHVRARTALVEVGAQTNTYAEALNAMEPLSEILCTVLDGE